jgi:uncharacterized protein YbjT (DUF2867 family)
MKYVITGGAGHISNPLAEKLLSKGYEVTVIGRNAKNVADLISKGAKAAIGSVENVSFLTNAFAGADAVFTLVPPNMAAPDWKGWIAQIGKNYAQAIKINKIKHVVNLSSIGAHLTDGCGPVSGLHRVENALNELHDTNIKHLRPAYFYNNLLANIGMIKNLGIIGGNYGGTNLKVVLADPNDIAEVAAQELMDLNFFGHTVRYIASDERTTDDIAKTLGAAIGKPGLNWVLFKDADALNGMMQAGLTEEIAKNFVEMNHSLQIGDMTADYWKNHPASLQKTKLEDFAKVFAAVYNSEEALAAH